MRDQPTQLTGIVIAIVAANLFSSKVLFAKLAYGIGSDPLQLLAIRMGVALPFFVGIGWLAFRKSNFNRPKAKDYLGMLGLGIMGYYGSSLLDFHGMQYLTASMERLILYLYPTFLLVVRFFIEGFRPQRNEIIALIVAYFGAGIFYWDEQQSVSNQAWIGALLVGGAALSYAFYLYGSANYINKFGSRFYAAYSSGVSAVAMVLHFSLSRGLEGVPDDKRIFYIGITIGVFCTVVPTFLLHKAIALIGASKTGLMGTSGMIAPFFVGVLLFSEPVNLQRIVGTILVIFAVILLNKKR